jgi:hypothetical protein
MGGQADDWTHRERENAASTQNNKEYSATYKQIQKCTVQILVLQE